MNTRSHPILIAALWPLLAITSCVKPEISDAGLTNAERDILRNYHESQAMVERAAQICLSRKLSKADVLKNTTNLMRREVEDDSITFFFAPGQYWMLTFDDDGNALAAEITGQTITRRD